MQPARTPGSPSPATLAFYNAVPNLLWSRLCFLPVSTFCYQYMPHPWIYRLIAASLLPYALPTSQLHHLELSSKPATYRCLGVHLANRFVQNSTIVNRLLRRKNPRHQRLRSRASALSLARDTYHRERFHWVLFLFFLLSSLYAAAHHQELWALLITLTNILYNLHPIWLQQYLRLRLRRFRPQRA